jgi:hypothetical protein
MLEKAMGTPLLLTGMFTCFISPARATMPPGSRVTRLPGDVRL